MKRTVNTGDITTSTESPHDSNTPADLPAEQTQSVPVLSHRTPINSSMEIVGESTQSPITTGEYSEPEISSRSTNASTSTPTHKTDDFLENLKQKALSGDAEAQFELGVCYDKDRGVDKNDVEAFQWFQKAAGQGHAKAQFNLAVTLIITANERVYRNLRAIIDQLDARRAQVYVESLIVEVSADKAAEFGIQWAGVSGDSGSSMRVGVLTGFSSEGNNLVSQASSLLGTSKAPLAPGNGLMALLFKQNNGSLGLGMLARALEKNVKANILSMPNLITLDNEEARIIVGQNVPFITGQFTTAASGGAAGVNPFQTIERRDIGLSLRVRPQISEGGTVRMAIYQETSNIQQSTVSGLITSKRSIDTNVLVDDGQIIVLGGLIEDTVNDTVEKIPLLGDIPLLGYFFRYQSKQRGKTNLMVFLRPTVIRNDNQSIAVASDRYDYIRGAQHAIQPDPNVFLPHVDTPALAPLEKGRPAGGNLLQRDFNEPERGPMPVTPSSSSGSSTVPMQPMTPPEVFPIEPPVIDLR